MKRWPSTNSRILTLPKTIFLQNQCPHPYTHMQYTQTKKILGYSSTTALPYCSYVANCVRPVRTTNPVSRTVQYIIILELLVPTLYLLAYHY